MSFARVLLLLAAVGGLPQNLVRASSKPAYDVSARPCHRSFRQTTCAPLTQHGIQAAHKVFVFSSSDSQIAILQSVTTHNTLQPLPLEHRPLFSTVREALPQEKQN